MAPHAGTRLLRSTLAVVCGLLPLPASAGTPTAVPAFTTFGWVSPPPAETTPARYLELAGVGMNVAVPAWDDPHERGENLRRLDLAAAVGIRCLVADDRIGRVMALGIDTPEAGVVVDSIVADYRGHPGFLGYYLGDEPSSNEWPVLGRLYAVLRARDPEHPAWNNLYGFPSQGTAADSAAWVVDDTSFLDQVRPGVLCNDHYDFRTGFDYGDFVANIAGPHLWSFERGVPFWSIVQLVPHANIRPITEGELAWQVSMLLAYGARGVGYFTYWTPAPDPRYNWGPAIITYDGARTPWYDVVAALNQRVRPAGETLAGFTWLSTQHAGSVPRGGQAFRGDDWLGAVGGRAAIGRFTDAAGTPYLVVVNSDSLAPREVTLALVGATGVSRLGLGQADWRAVPGSPTATGASVALALDPGEFALLRIDGSFDGGRVPRLGPTLAVVPNPAADEVRFDVARLAGDARLEVLDATGRRVWSRAAPAGRTSLAWHGERNAGGSAPAGVYLVRILDARGAATRRLTWLSGR
jgi:hypothetical protein